MSQIPIPNPTKQLLYAVAPITGATNFIILSVINITMAFEDNTPVKIINGKLQVKENLLQENRIYSAIHKDQEFFVRRNKGITEIFQMVD
jgi:hypothetical protein